MDVYGITNLRTFTATNVRVTLYVRDISVRDHLCT